MLLLGRLGRCGGSRGLRKHCRQGVTPAMHPAIPAAGRHPWHAVLAPWSCCPAFLVACRRAPSSVDGVRPSCALDPSVSGSGYRMEGMSAPRGTRLTLPGAVKSPRGHRSPLINTANNQSTPCSGVCDGRTILGDMCLLHPRLQPPARSSAGQRVLRAQARCARKSIDFS